jgi:toxin ParE1/3/4
VEIRPQVEHDFAEAAEWYDQKEGGLGAIFIEEIIAVWDALAINPFLNSRRHPRNIRWRYPERFPYRIIYEVNEQDQKVIVAAVLHAARHERQW